MDKKNIPSILQDALEHELPSTQIDLLTGIKERLVAGTIQHGETMYKTNVRRNSRLALMIFVIVVLLVIGLITPPGRAFAQNVLQFFRRSDSRILSLPPEQIVPTPGGLAPTAQPPAPLVSVAEAEAVAGFDAKELSSLPQGFTFSGAMAAGGGITIEYQAQGRGGQLIINESKNGFMQSDWDQAPAEFISSVRVRELGAEIVQGTYVVYPGETLAKWNPDAPILRLRWIEDGIWFEMAKFGKVESIAYLDKDGLIDLAEGMVYSPSENQSIPSQQILSSEVSQPASGVDPALLSQIDDVKGIANFHIKVLPSIPLGMVFAGVTATSGSVNIRYESEEPGAGTLSMGESLGDENWEQYPAGAIQKVEVGDLEAELIRGANVFLPGATTSTWNPDVNVVNLRWIENGVRFSMLLTGGGNGSLAYLDENGLIELAESMVYMP